MANYNKVLLMGNLTRDPELRYTPSNQPVANFGIAINRRYTTAEGERREEVTFVDCEAWGKTAETIKNYLAKGRPIFVEGRLKLDTWQDQQGEKKSKLKVVVESFQFVDSRPGGSGGGGEGGHSGPPRSAAGGPAGQGRASSPAHGDHDHGGLSEDDIPF